MANLDADALAQLVIDLGLVTEDKLRECRDEEGRLGSTAAEALRALERKGYLTPYQSSKLLKGDRDGYFMGQYRVLYKISSGSFGRVFRADDPRNGVVVAIKVLRQRWTNDAHKIELFEREAKLGMSLRHPNIVSILSMGRDQASRQHYIVMEFVEGGNLRDFLAIRKKLEAAEALHLLEDCASGLAYSFSRGLTHRDMKLTNVLISAQGVAKLVDFGLAGLSGGAAVEEESQVDRSVDYAGLEKATSVKPGDVRSDIYFLGCVFYEMLTGRSPLVMTKDRQVRMQRQRFENVQPISPAELAAPPIVFQLVERMMSLDPHRRYQNPNQLVEAIREARREVGDQREAAAPPVPAATTIYVVERNQRLQEVLRDKFSELGYRVLMSSDPKLAANRFRQKPFEAIIMDVGSVGEEAVGFFDRILAEANKTKHPCAGIVVLSENQADWVDKIRTTGPHVAVLVRPVTLRELSTKLCELVPLSKDGE